MFLLRLAERGFREGKEDDTGIKCHVLRGLVLTAKHHAGSDDGLCRHPVRARILLGLSAASPQSFQIGYLADVKVVLVFVQHDKGIDRLRYTVVHGRNGGDTQVGRINPVQEEGLEGGGERGLAGSLLAKQVEYGEMTSTAEYDVTEQGGKQVAESDVRVLSEYLCQP